ncbi:ABC transporter ATP-binding protein [Streptomyces sp. TRM66268-LWL]|uniref:ABC transporter ATP-binding protein n=1 Tax=Streptomyces polyasparticus TaxID=2767826 RepID=A0ABR7S9R7_9ACTN|nr:ABC transporter ATP-binding protein [Streptomyces polyasparticus]MBC9711083.1 ABC transporter ATP-binding protein [Streptomyces polyasparticus]
MTDAIQKAGAGTTTVLEVQDLDVAFGKHHVLKEVSLTVPQGRTLGLVGESGSGKSTLAKAIVGLVKPAGGRILLDGVDLTHTKRTVAVRRRVQMIPQDPYSSLNPRMTIGETLAEALDPRRASVKAHRTEIEALLNRVALDGEVAARHPQEFSGGQRQRIAVARALAVRPALIIADEVTSALDTSVQAEVLGVLRELRRELDLTMLFISHDLAVVRHVCDEVAVLKDGELVELAARDALFGEPRHPYTRLLLDSVPDGGPLRTAG